MLELDVRRTNDDVVIVCHDMNLQRTCGVDLRVDELKFSDLPVMSKKLGIESEPGKYFEGNGDDDRKIPTLDSIFEAFPDVGINIDIKNCDARLVHGVDALVRRHKREAITVWGTFSHETTELCRAANARVGLLFSFKRVLHILVLFYTGLLPFVDVSETHFEIPMISSFKAASLGELGLTKQPRNAIRTAVAMTLDAILTRPLLFRHLNARGIQGRDSPMFKNYS
jgi:glycerophosphoryl diester phosphodiesterase